MALADFLSLTDDTLAATYERKGFNRDKARGLLLTRLDRVAEQFATNKAQPGRKMFSVNNDVVRLALPFKINGRSDFHIPSERFLDAIQQLKDGVANGDLDAALEADAGSGAAKSVDMRRTRRPRRKMTEEAKAEMNRKRRATMAERGIKPGPRQDRG